MDGVVLNTGPIVALLDVANPAHLRCVATVADISDELIVPAAVLVESTPVCSSSIETDRGPTLAEDVGSGAYRLHPRGPQTLTLAADIERQHACWILGLSMQA